jgi:hypothetical protein
MVISRINILIIVLSAVAYVVLTVAGIYALFGMWAH